MDSRGEGAPDPKLTKQLLAGDPREVAANLDKHARAPRYAQFWRDIDIQAFIIIKWH